MILIDLHVHPSPWINGSGAFRSFAETAVRKGINILGFSEHGPAANSDPRYRGLEKHKLDEYLTAVQKIKDEFKGILQIFCGL